MAPFKKQFKAQINSVEGSLALQSSWKEFNKTLNLDISNTSTKLLNNSYTLLILNFF